MSDLHDHEHEDYEVPQNAVFNCPNCGEISRDDVMFLCNTCKQSEMTYQDGMYMCPACLIPGQNFECLLCESKEVAMTAKN